MAAEDVRSVVDADEALDALVDPTSSEVFHATRKFGAISVAAAAARRALGGGGGLPEGWTQAGDPAAVDMNGGQLVTTVGGTVLVGGNDGLDSVNITPTAITLGIDDDGVLSANTLGLSVAGEVSCFTADDSRGATAALDAGGLQITNVAEGTDPSDAATVSQISGLHPVLQVTIEVTSAEILAIADTPKLVLAAPGTGKIIIPLQIIGFLHGGSTPYEMGAGSFVLATNNDGPVSPLAQMTLMAEEGQPRVSVDGWSAYSLISDDQPVRFSANSNPTVGDGDLTVVVRYSVLDVP